MSQFSQKNPRTTCANPACEIEVSVKSIRGPDARGYCSRICASTARFAGRYVGARSSRSEMPDLAEKMKL